MGESFSGAVVRVSVRDVEQFTVHADGLDPIRAVVENFDEGNQGMITLTCYGRAWTAYWGAMATRSVREFFLSCDAPYLVGCLVHGMTPTARRFVAGDEAYLDRIVKAVQQAFRNTRAVVRYGVVSDAGYPADHAEAVPRDTAPFFVLPRDYGHSFVKEGDFFRSQGGLKGDWGTNWIPVRADSIEAARRLADAMVEKQPARNYNSEAPGV